MWEKLSAGTRPVNLFWLKYSSLSPISAVNVSGMEPVKSLPLTSNSVSPVSSPIESGNVPSRPLSARRLQRTVSVSNEAGAGAGARVRQGAEGAAEAAAQGRGRTHMPVMCGPEHCTKMKSSGLHAHGSSRLALHLVHVVFPPVAS